MLLKARIIKMLRTRHH